MKAEEYISASTLTKDQQVRLLQLTKSGGYTLLVEIMEKICTIAETEHFRMKPADYSADQIARSHAEARGQNLLMERTLAKLQIEIKGLLDSQSREANEGREVPELSDKDLELP